MRLIDADALLKAIKENYVNIPNDGNVHTIPLGKDIESIITDAPTVQRDENIIEVDKRDLFCFARSAIKDALTADENMNEAHLWSDATDLTVKLFEKLQIPTVQREEMPESIKELIRNQQQLPADMQKILYDNLFDLYESPAPLPVIPLTHDDEVIEKCAKVIENGNFLTDTSAEAMLAKSAAKAIRALKGK